MTKEPKEPIPAAQRFDGIIMRVTRKYASKLKNVDILILSPTHGLIPPEKKIPYSQPLGGGWKWNKVQFSKDKLEEARVTNLRVLKEILSKRQYCEIYVNVGKAMLQLIEGFEEMIPQNAKLTYARGRGIGPKIADMKNWMESKARC